MAKPLPTVTRWAPLVEKYAAKYNEDPAELLAQIDIESDGRTGLTSSKQAGGVTQFIPSTGKTYGVDFGRSKRAVETQIAAQARYLHDLGYSKDPLGAFAKYAGGPGNPQSGYANMVKSLSKVYRGVVGSSAPASALTSPSGATGAPESAAAPRSVPQAGTDVLALLQSLAPKPAPRPSMGLAAPSFSAQPTLPTGAQLPASGGGPAPKPDIGALLASITTAGGDVSHTAPASGGSADPSAPAPGGASIKGAIVGSPVAGIKPHGATHQTLGLAGYPAYDYMAKAGTAVVAPVSGKIIKLSGSDPKNGPSQGPHGPFGYSVYVQGDDGKTYFLTHLGSRNVKVGQRVGQGTQIGTIGNYAKYGTPSHVHVGVHG